MRIPRLVALPVAGAALIASLASCTYWKVNFNQWQAGQTRNSVVVLGNAFDIKPFTYPGHDPASYKAADFMLPDGGHSAYWVNKGWALANHARANAGKLHVHYIVYRQKIWNVQRAGEGWRPMANRGGWTANHYDHVHISFY